MSLLMYDCDSDGEGIPDSPQAVAGYMGGGNYQTLVERFPHAQHFSIIASQALAAQGYPADCLDVERGDALPSQAPGWIETRIRAGAYRPCVYASQASYMPEVIQALAHLPRSSYRLWIAHWGQPAVVPAGYDAIQFRNTPEFDESALLDDFFAPPAPPKPHYPTLSAEEKGWIKTFAAEAPDILAHSGVLSKQLNDELAVFEQRLGEMKLVAP